MHRDIKVSYLFLFRSLSSKSHSIKEMKRRKVKSSSSAQPLTVNVAVYLSIGPKAVQRSSHFSEVWAEVTGKCSRRCVRSKAFVQRCRLQQVWRLSWSRSCLVHTHRLQPGGQGETYYLYSAQRSKHFLFPLLSPQDATRDALNGTVKKLWYCCNLAGSQISTEPAVNASTAPDVTEKF